jgi:DNA helicase-2/ATP-dependent DNA helicase PcrA
MLAGRRNPYTSLQHAKSAGRWRWMHRSRAPADTQLPGAARHRNVEHLLIDLTAAQREAVCHVEGPLLILAGPGSGKTRVVTRRIAWLLAQGIPARQILALTFTNKAADEMRRRVAELVPGAAVWTSTFHRFCARLLREYAPLVGLTERYTIYDTSDSLQAVRRAIEALDLDLTYFTPDRVLAAISWAKNNLISAEQYEARPGSPLGRIVAQVYPAYQKELLTASAVDFDDLLLHVAGLLRDNPEVRGTLDARYRYILVDEYQDTNLAQYAIVRALSVDYPNLAVTGDPDQSIYGWRGANLKNILEFERDYPRVKVVRLEQNYRSTKRILRVADRLIAHNKQRKEKGLFTENEDGTAVRLTAYLTQRDEAERIAAQIAAEVRSGRRRARDFAIFYRMNALSRSLEFALRDYGVAYQMVNGLEFYQRKEIKDVLAYLHLLNNPRDNVAFLRIVNTPPRGIGRSTLVRLSEHAQRHGLTLLEAACQSGLIESLPKRAAVAVARFVALLDRLTLKAIGDVEELLGHVLAESGYQGALQQSEAEEDFERLANIEELLTAAREFDAEHPGGGHLDEFLEQAALVNETDAWEVDDDRVTLMTLHAAKGLEFPVVFIVALEESILPHERSRESADQLEEERRLLFVGLTRAQRELHLSLARYREFRGQRRMTVPSQFLLELPHDELDMTETPWGAMAAAVESSAAQAAEFESSAHQGEAAAVVEPSPGGRSQRPAAALASRVTTAAELANEPAAEAISISPDMFHQGMVVRHPEYGLGKIVALSGQGGRRSATVAFASAAGQKKFVLAHSALRPAKS